MIGGLLIGGMVGVFVGTLLAGLMHAADEASQLPTLGKGTWLVSIDQWGDMVRCESHVCFETSVKRLLDEEQA